MKTSFMNKSLNRSLVFFDTYSFRIIFTLAVCAFIFFLINRIAGIFIVNADPWEIIENNAIYSIQRMLGGYSLYTDPELPPYSITQYTPLYYSIVYGCGKLLHIRADDVLSIYKLSRTISLFFNLFFAIILYGIAYRFFYVTRAKAVLMGILAFLILEPHSYSRPDSIYNAMALLSIFCYLEYLNRNNSAKSFVWLAVTALVAVISIFSKQSGIILPALFLFYQFIILKNWKGGLILALSFAGFMFLFLLLFSGSSMHIFYMNTVRGLDNGINLYWFENYIVKGYFFSVKGLLLAPLCIYSATLLVQSPKKTESLLGWSIVALFIFALLTGLKYGSTASYFTEAGALGLVGFIFIENKIKTPATLCVLFIGLVLGSLVLDPRVMNLTNRTSRYSKKDYKKQKEVYQFVQKNDSMDNDELVFVDIPGREDFMVSLFYAKGIFPHKDIVYCCTWPRKSFDYSSFEKIKKQGKIKYVISQKDSVEYLGVRFDDYKKIKKMNGYIIYEAPSTQDTTAILQQPSGFFFSNKQN